MNNLQAFAKNEKNIRRLISSMANDDCNICPAFKFCKKYEESEDCGDAFVAWALTEKKEKKSRG